MREGTDADIRHGISLNSSQLTTDIQSINALDRLVIGGIATITSPLSRSVYSQVTFTGLLNPGDVIRPHTNAAPNATATANTIFTVKSVKPTSSGVGYKLCGKSRLEAVFFRYLV